MYRYAFFLIATTPLWAALSESDKKLYKVLAAGAETILTENLFEELLKSEDGAPVRVLLQYVDRGGPLPATANPSGELSSNSPENVKALIKWALLWFGNPEITEQSTINQIYKKISVSAHQDKTLNPVKNALTKFFDTKNLSNASTQQIFKNAEELTKNIFQEVGYAKTILEYAFEQLPVDLKKIHAQLAGKELPADAIIKEKLISILSPTRKPQLSRWAFAFGISSDFDEIIETFHNKPDAISRAIIAASRLAQLGLVTFINEALAYGDIIPLVQKRIPIYKEALKKEALGETQSLAIGLGTKKSPLELSFEAKDVNTLIDIIAYNAYLDKPDDFELPPQIDELGALIDHFMAEMLNEFFVIATLERIAKDPATKIDADALLKEFKNRFSIYGWSYLQPLGKRIEDGVSWSLTLKTPSRIAEKLNKFLERPKALRRAQELITLLEKIKIQYPALSKIAEEKIIAIKNQLPQSANASESLVTFAQSLQALSGSIKA